MSTEGLLYYKRKQKRCEMAAPLAAEAEEALTDRVCCGDYSLRSLADALAMVEQDGILNIEEAKAVAVRVAQKVIRRAEERMVDHLARARAAERLLEEEFRPLLAELQGEHGGIL